jgi:transglutaminase-like putative cysteine protease
MRDAGRMTRLRAAALAPVALALVTIAAGLGLARVFDDAAFVGPVLWAAAIPHAAGALGRRLRLGAIVVVVVTVAALVLCGAWLLAPGTTAYGIPTPATLGRMADLVDGGWRVFRTGIAPVEPTRGVVLLCALIVASAALVADLLAFRARATIGALVPSLLLFVLASTLGTDDLLVVTTLAYLVAALVFLLLASQAQLEVRRAWCTGRRLRSDASVVNAGLIVGGAAVLAGLLLAPALPGAGDGPLLDYRSAGGRGGPGASDYRTLSPLVDIRARLLDQSDQELFRVRSPVRLAWRVAALDRFDGTVWGIESTARDASEILPRRAGRGTVEQEFTIGPLGDQWLPAAFEPRSVDVAGARIIPESSTLIAPRASISGLRYTVRSRVPPSTPGPDQIAGTGARDFDYDRYTVLPGDFPASVRRQARAIVRGTTNRYDAAKRLEQFFLDGSFTYDLRVRGGSDTNAIVAFLQRRRGFCEQFAGTYAAMARAVGLPARVAVGFTAGSYDDDAGEYVVQSRNAHAWPEVWLAGLGWTSFEPTPAGTAPGQADAGLGAATTDASASTTTSPTAVGAPSTTPPAAAGAASPRGANEVLAGSGLAADDSPWDRRVLTAIGIVGAAVVGTAAWVLLRIVGKARRRARRRHAPTPDRSVAGAWQDALEGLAEAGLPASAALTPNEQADAYRARGAPGDAVEALAVLAEHYGRIGWSPRQASDGDVTDAWTSADAVRAALAEHATRTERARRALRAPEPVGS